ncbi:MAG: efflux RND transporter periplasmic adaptor subunit [Spirochaetaceae bacterium]|jgi:multidrug efflux pump subunit AcrA (membrane-fusion protein)|nr:efflux RND transporter periplasmic adaptor subunit [Spirochaetaceae bacterium]
MYSKIGIVIIFAAAFIFSGSCKRLETAKNNTQTGQNGGKGTVKRGPGGQGGNQIFAVTTTKAVEGDIAKYLVLAGDIVSGSTVDAYSDAQGRVTRVYVSVGARVARGQALALVDPSKPGMNYVQHTVQAPISGTVTSVPAEVGMTISQSTPLVKIAGGGALEIQLFVPERFISQVNLRQQCEITLDAYPDEVFRGSVQEVSPTVDPVSRTESIKVNVDNQGSRLKAGMFAKVKVVTEKKDKAVTIPMSAIVQRQGKSVVFIISEAGAEAAGKKQDSDAAQTGGGAPAGAPSGPTGAAIKTARQVEVTTGIISDNVAEITSGLQAGDEIIDKGMSLLTDGASVNIVNIEPQAE